MQMRCITDARECVPAYVEMRGLEGGSPLPPPKGL